MVVNSASLDIFGSAVACKPEEYLCHGVVGHAENFVEILFYGVESYVLNLLFFAHRHVVLLVFIFTLFLFLPCLLQVLLVLSLKLCIGLLLDGLEVQFSKVVENGKCHVLKLIDNVLLESLELFVVWVHSYYVALGLKLFFGGTNYIVSSECVDQVQYNHGHSILEGDIAGKLLHFYLFHVFSVVHLVGLIAKVG